jgi:hypothetical protein
MTELRKTILQDSTEPTLDLFFTQAIGSPSTLAASAAIDDTSISVTDNIISVGNYVGVFSGASGEGRFYFGEALTVAGAGPYTIGLDTPLDFAFESGDPVIATTRDLNVDGSATTQTFNITVGGASSDLVIGITRIIVSMITTSQPDDALFGDLAKLTNGLVLRRKDGIYLNKWNVKDNSELAALSFDVEYTTRSIPLGSYGVRCRYTFAGQDKHGAIVRLGSNEELQLIVQDDLTGLTNVRVVAGGRVLEGP